MSEQPQGEALMARCPNRKVSDDQWLAIRSLVEKGVTHKEVAAQFGISHFTVARRATRDKWITPMRLARTKNNTVAVSDPASVVASIWTARADAARESTYQGAKKALERFWAMSPIPQSFAEAATADKLLSKSIDPSGNSSGNSVNNTVNILASNGFMPKPAIDV